MNLMATLLFENEIGQSSQKDDCYVFILILRNSQIVVAARTTGPICARPLDFEQSRKSIPLAPHSCDGRQPNGRVSPQ
jgi:hypothetical protein